MVSPISAVSPLSSAISGTSATASGAVSAAGDAGSSFGSVLSSVVSGAVDKIGAGESAAIQGITGAMPATKVVESVMEAQRTLQEILAVRDKLVGAYKDIAGMQI